MSHLVKLMKGDWKGSLSGTTLTTLRTFDLLTMGKSNGALLGSAGFLGQWHVLYEMLIISSGTSEGAYGYTRNEYGIRLQTGGSYIANNGTQFLLGSGLPALSFVQSSGSTWAAKAQPTESGNYVVRYFVTIKGFTDDTI